MRDLLPNLTELRVPFAIATIVAMRGRTPRRIGTAMLVTAEGTVHGAVSGGCVDADVHRLCRDVLAGAPPQTVDYGRTPDDPFAIGLNCEGALRVFVRRVDPANPAITELTKAAADGRAAGHATITRGPAWLLGRTLTVTRDLPSTPGPETHPSRTATPLQNPTIGRFRSSGTVVLGDDWPQPEPARRIAAATETMLATDASGLRTFQIPDDVQVFIECLSAAPRLLIFGAVDVAPALSQLGVGLGYRVTVCDARPLFADPARFPSAVEVVADWPHRYLAAIATDTDTAICSLTHDAKFDIPLLAEALARPVGYVGALGSRGTAARRVGLLRQAGVTDAQLARLRAPIGHDLGGGRPTETALSIMAEVVASRNGGSGTPLSALDGPIHGRT